MGEGGGSRVALFLLGGNGMFVTPPHLVYIGSLSKVHKLRICVPPPPHFLAPSYATARVVYVVYLNHALYFQPLP